MASEKRKQEGRGASASRPSLFQTPMSFGLAAKLLLLALINGIALLAIPRMARDKAWFALAATLIAAILINYVYLSKRRIPAKYLVPGLVPLFIYQLYPIAYTAQTAFTNYGTGNLLTKTQAIEKIVEQSRQVTDDAPRYTMALLRNSAGDLRLLLENEGGKRFVASRTTFEPLDDTKATIEEGVVRAVGDYKRLNLKEALAIGDTTIQNYIVKTETAEIRPESLTSAAVSVQRFRYDAKTDAIVDMIDNKRYVPKQGTFTATDGTIITPGFKANIGWRNFTRSFTDTNLRGAFVRVFIWNYVFAIGTVIFDSALGLLLAIILNHDGMRGRRIYRSLLILPYAMPSIMMILIWSQGVLNTGYGAINRAFGADIGWLDNPWLARLSIFVVNMWLGFGYKFLLFSGQLQSIPKDVKEAAHVDGATGWQTFRKITLPLLLTGLAPMLISSFAFNFNNAGLILAMTNGGPPIQGSGSIAGHTDILISYTYRVAFGSGRGQDWGYASALSILIFIMVASISALSFRSTKQFEEIQ
jgi:arabinogalactan oligomer / maltooligosaccharide transport system permease protein